MRKSGRLSAAGHVIYIAVIVVLILTLVVASAWAVRARRRLGEIRDRFGVVAGARATPARAEPLRDLGAENLLRARTYAEYQKEVDALVERAQSLGDLGENARLASACAHSLEGGKRLRPVIVLEVARATSLRRWKKAAGAEEEEPPVADAADAALFIEYLHTASLIIDDHPDFDDDAVRRGREALHAKHGPATAQMAALTLVAGAFNNICRQVDWLRENCPEIGNPDRLGMSICGEVSRALGAAGAAGGQHMDTTVPAAPGGRSAEALAAERGGGVATDIAKKKTASFYEIAFVAGWLIGGGSSEASELEHVRAAGQDFGTAFQIADDIGDMAQDARRQEAGKPGWNWALIYGSEAAEREVQRRLNSCRYTLARLGLFTDLWKEIYEKVWKMAEGPLQDS